jgi:hypothetical protein
MFHRCQEHTAESSTNTAEIDSRGGGGPKRNWLPGGSKAEGNDECLRDFATLCKIIWRRKFENCGISLMEKN